MSKKPTKEEFEQMLKKKQDEARGVKTFTEKVESIPSVFGIVVLNFMP